MARSKIYDIKIIFREQGHCNCDFEPLDPRKGWLEKETIKLVVSFDFGLTIDPLSRSYCVDYYYNGRGKLESERSWDLDHICMYDDNDDSIRSSGKNISLKRMNDILDRYYGVRLFEVFRYVLLDRLKKGYPRRKK